MEKSKIKRRILFVILVASFGPTLSGVAYLIGTNETQSVDRSQNQSLVLNQKPSNSSDIDDSIQKKWDHFEFNNGFLRDFEFVIKGPLKSGTYMLEVHHAQTTIQQAAMLMHSKKRLAKIYLVVIYRLVYNDLVRVDPNIFCDTNSIVAVHNREAELGAHCIADLYAGAPLTDHEKNYCRQHQVQAEFNAQDNYLSLQLDYMLPRQLYEFNVSVNWNHVLVAKSMEFSSQLYCTVEDIPRVPPLADLTSFDYKVPNLTMTSLTNPIDKGEELIHIYWRSSPQLMAGSPTYYCCVRCKYYDNAYDDHNLWKFRKDNIITNKLLISKPIDRNLDCSLFTCNHYGLSENSTRVFVPKRANRLYLGRRFKLVAYEISNFNYRLEWTPFQVHSNDTSTSVEILAKGSEPTTFGGSIVLYWCSMDITGDCNHLSGLRNLGNTTKSSYNLTLPEYSSISTRLFGLGVALNGPIINSGIVWAKCSAIDEHAFAIQPMKVVGAVVETNNNNRLLSMSWTFPDCDPITFKIKTYEFNYCRTLESDGCSFLWGQSTASDPINFPFSEDSRSCKTVKVQNRFNEDENILEMEPKVKYYIRARYILDNGKTSQWSIPISVPGTEDCGMGWWLFFLIPTLLILGAVLYRKWSIWYLYSRSILCRFKNTRANVSDSVGMKRKLESELMARKYCVNKETTDLVGELSMDMLEYMDGFITNGEDGVDRNSAMVQSFDYIPRKLIENNSDETTPENFSDSMRDETKRENSSEHDEISISSQSSFLNNILNETLITSHSSESNN